MPTDPVNPPAAAPLDSGSAVGLDDDRGSDVFAGRSTVPVDVWRVPFVTPVVVGDMVVTTS